MPKVWAFVSPVGGKGQSTFCMHLAAALAVDGKKAVLVDTSCFHPSLDVLCGVSEQVVYTVSDVVNGSVSPERALLPISFSVEKGVDASFRLLPISPMESLSQEMFARALDALSAEGDADFIIMDVHPSFYEAIRALADASFLLTDATASGLRAAEAFAAANPQLARFLLMRASLKAEEIRNEPSLLDIIDLVSLPIGGIVPYEPLCADNRPLYQKRFRKTAYMRAVKNIAQRLAGNDVPLLRDVPLDGITRRAYLERVSRKGI